MASLYRAISKLPKNGIPQARACLSTKPATDPHSTDPTSSQGGVNFISTDAQKEYLELAEKFTKEEVIPNAPHYDKTGEYPWDIIKKAHEIGLMNLHIPEAYGGMGLGTLDGCLITEKVAYGCTGIMTALEANGLGRFKTGSKLVCQKMVKN